MGKAAKPKATSLEAEPNPFPVPTNKREAASLLADTGHGLLSQQRRDARYVRRIANLRKKANALEKERKLTSADRLSVLRHMSNALASYALANWEKLHEKGTRLIRFGTGDIRKRDVGHPTIVVTDEKAFFKAIRNRGEARKFIRYPPPEPNLQALRDNIDVAKSLKSVRVTYETKVEIRSRHSENYLQAVLPTSEDTEELVWEVAVPETKKKSDT